MDNIFKSDMNAQMENKQVKKSDKVKLIRDYI